MNTHIKHSKKQTSHFDVAAVIKGRRKHALLHGDCLDELRQLPAECVDAVITDPPYGIAYCGLEDRLKPIANDKHPFIWWLYDAARVLKTGGTLICFCPWKKQDEFKLAITAAGLVIRSHMIWDRMNGGMGATHCTAAPRHDIIWFATKGRYRFENGRPQSVFSYSNIAPTKREHSTQKPDGLMQKLVEKFSPKNGVVLDPCMGSGSTITAALAMGRRGIGIELDADNYQIAVRRCSETLLPNKLKTKGKSIRMPDIRFIPTSKEALCA